MVRGIWYVRPLCYTISSIDTLTFRLKDVKKCGVINVLIPKINEKDTLIVYYSGQSCRVSEQFKFCTKGTYLSHKDFITKCINKVKTQRVVIVIDVCYSGDFNTFKSKDKPGRVVDAGDITAFLKPSGKICFFASQAKEIAPGSSAFTHAFVKSIENVKGIVQF